MQNFKGMLAEFYDQASMLLGLPDISFSPIDFIEILIIAFLFYHILLWIKSTKAWNLFKGIIVILLFVLVSAIFQMNTILWLAERTLNVGLIALVIIFSRNFVKHWKILEKRISLVRYSIFQNQMSVNFPIEPLRN